MTIHPKKYSKTDFIKFLEKNNVNDEVTNKFHELPESIQRNGNRFKLDINVMWYGDGNTHYEFELNYYSEELIEYLFGSKVFKTPEISINNLLCELVNGKYIKRLNKKFCK